MAWIYLFIAGIFEIGWAVGMKYCNDFKPSVPLFIVIFSMIFSVVFLWLASKTLPMSIAYAVWTGIGIVGVTLYGIIVFKEPFSIFNLVFIGMILFGIVGLKLGIK